MIELLPVDIAEYAAQPANEDILRDGKRCDDMLAVMDITVIGDHLVFWIVLVDTPVPDVHFAEKRIVDTAERLAYRRLSGALRADDRGQLSF